MKLVSERTGAKRFQPAMKLIVSSGLEHFVSHRGTLRSPVPNTSFLGEEQSDRYRGNKTAALNIR